MRITLINPRLCMQKWDFLGSGVPYWPLELAIFASALRDLGESVQILDLFGTAPDRITRYNTHWRQGVPISECRPLLDAASSDAFVLYAISYMSMPEQLDIVGYLRRTYPEKIIMVLENAQAVTGYDLSKRAHDFFMAGASFLICGAPYANLSAIRDRLSGTTITLSNAIESVSPLHPPQRLQPEEGYNYPYPAWDLVPLKAYWKLPYAHGPKRGRYLPMLTTRGCPYPCDFCVLPATSRRRWSARSPQSIVAEMMALRDRYGVHDFHIEDVNPTVDFRVWQEVCTILIDARVNIRFYFVSGTKAETIPINAVPQLAKAGCRYISISPESGDPEVMRQIGKRFNIDHAVSLVAACRHNKIATQACFLTGHPGETALSCAFSQDLLRQLIKVGLDEAAIFTVSPLPGSRLYNEKPLNIKPDSFIAFTPAQRLDGQQAADFRRRMLWTFFTEKLRRGTDIWWQGLRAVFRCPATKMENVPWRLVYLCLSLVRSRKYKQQ